MSAADKTVAGCGQSKGMNRTPGDRLSPPPETVPAVLLTSIAGLKDPKAKNRMDAIARLAEYPWVPAVPELERISVKDKSKKVRAKAASALRFIREYISQNDADGSTAAETHASQETVADVATRPAPQAVDTEVVVASAETKTYIDSIAIRSPEGKPLSENDQHLQLQTELARHFQSLIPKLPLAAEEKAASIVALNRILDQTFWQEMRGEAEPLIKSLFQDIPDDYEGKCRRSTLINALLTALDRCIIIRDDTGRSHLCSTQVIYARGTDPKGYFRLRSRTARGGSQKAFEMPLFEEIQIVETVHQSEGHQNPARGTPTI